MSQSDPTYVTHFEKAAELGIRPSEVKRRARAQQLGDYGHSGGVYYFSTAPQSDAHRDDFFLRILAVRYNWVLPE